MIASGNQREYWDRVAPTAVFTLPLDVPRLRRFVESRARILDYGCGYGRQLAELLQLGYRNLAGVDASAAMVERARRRLPGLQIDVCESPPTPHPEASFDAILLSAVLTCIARDDEQRELIAELWRTLRSGGLLLLGDFLLHSDERNLARYESSTDTGRPYGVFEIDDGAVLRHHSVEWILTLTGAFECVSIEPFAARTMNGNLATGVSFIGRKPEAESNARRQP